MRQFPLEDNVCHPIVVIDPCWPICANDLFDGQASVDDYGPLVWLQLPDFRWNADETFGYTTGEAMGVSAKEAENEFCLPVANLGAHLDDDAMVVDDDNLAPDQTFDVAGEGVDRRAECLNKLSRDHGIGRLGRFRTGNVVDEPH